MNKKKVMRSGFRNAFFLPSDNAKTLDIVCTMCYNGRVKRTGRKLNQKKGVLHYGTKI